jgi:hypothetical protein
VNDSGQLYTIEGVAAGVLMIVTVYLVVSTTTVLTPQDVHIVDMQLQQLGNDALAMMDMPDQYLNETGSLMRSNLSVMVEENDGQGFEEEFLRYLNMTTGTGPSVGGFAYNATVFYRTDTGVQNYTFHANKDYYRENAVKVSRWVFLQPFVENNHPSDMRTSSNQSVLMEVLLWRV